MTNVDEVWKDARRDCERGDGREVLIAVDHWRHFLDGLGVSEFPESLLFLFSRWAYLRMGLFRHRLAKELSSEFFVLLLCVQYRKATVLPDNKYIPCKSVVDVLRSLSSHRHFPRTRLPVTPARPSQDFARIHGITPSVNQPGRNIELPSRHRLAPTPSTTGQARAGRRKASTLFLEVPHRAGETRSNSCVLPSSQPRFFPLPASVPRKTT